MPHHVIALALKLIPTHRQNAKTVAALVDELALDGAASVIEATLMLLAVFGALQQHENLVRQVLGALCWHSVRRSFLEVIGPYSL